MNDIAREAARTETGQFGTQPHAIPTRGLRTLNEPVAFSVETVEADADDPDFEGPDEETTTAYEVDAEFAAAARHLLGVENDKAEVVVTRVDCEWVDGFTVEKSMTVYVECDGLELAIEGDEEIDPMATLMNNLEIDDLLKAS